MELVVRTAHGDAEITVESSGTEVLVGDVVEAVLGARTPGLVRIDGRAVPAATTLGSSGALVGSIIDVDEPVVAASDPVLVELVQIAGPGAGHRAPLSEGSFALGPSRRINAAPLSDAPVDDTVVCFDVAADGSVTVSATTTAWLDGVAVADEAQLWTSGPLSVAGHVYELRRPDRSPRTGARRFAGVGVDGTAAFNRPPRPAQSADPGPLAVPDGGAQVRSARRFPLLAMLAPLPIAVGMALLLGSPRFLLFGLMSPVMAGASWISERRQRTRDLDESRSTETGATAEFRRRAEERHRADRARRLAGDLDVIDIVDLAADAAPDLWARRPGDPDVFRVSLGLGDDDWQPILERSNASLASADSIVDELGPLRSVPIVADLLAERGVGLVGDELFTTSMARGLILHACTAHGPADLDVIVLTSPERLADWEWAKWLPHVRSAGSPRIYADPEQVAAWALAVARGWERPSRPTSPSHVTVIVVDEATWWRDRTAPLRPLFSDPTMPLRFVALTDAAEELPAVCTTVVTGEPGDTATVEHLLDGRATVGMAPLLVDETTALDVARHLAPLDDPDLPVAVESSLPSLVPISRLLELDRIDPDAIIGRWSPGRRAAAPTVVAGISEQGPLTIDLVDDGPHGLVAGTTGAGKSELLRSVIVGLATNLQPDEINFVLVDFKGGSAFDACAELPHTVGLVTDLDEHLAGRVLRCLRAELHHREVVLREAGASSLLEYQQLDGLDPLPRLVLVVDEFASVAAELPEFLPSLVDIAQRGRSLGLHMILATQRPAGVVDNKIKANTNLRIALRVQDDGDSLDVIGSRDAAGLPRRIPGRAYARFAAGELTQFQSAYSTGTSATDGGDRVDVTPWIIGRRLSPLENRLARRAGAAGGPGADAEHHADTDLERLVAAIRAASDRLGQGDQRQPAPPPLPRTLPLTELFSEHGGDAVPIGLIDLPDEQRRAPLWWEPGPGGSRIVYGIAGAGTSSLLVSLALGVAERYGADDVHLLAIDADTNTLAPLASLPHCGAVVRLDEGERIARLARSLGAEVDRRKELAARLGGPRNVASREADIVVLIDNVGALRQMLDDHRELDGTWQELERVIRDGQPLGVCAVITAKQERAVPSALATQIPDRLVMRLGDQFAYAAFGFRPADLPDFVPGRALRPDDKVEIHLVEPPADLAEHIAGLGLEAPTDRPPLRVDPLPPHVLVEEVVHAASASATELRAAVGLDTRTARPAIASIPFGETFFVTGPARSGRSSVLVALAASTKAADPDVRIFAVTARGGPLASCPAVDDSPNSPGDVADWVERIATTPGRRLVLVDDADRVSGPSFDRLAALVDDHLVVVVAGRADSLRAMGHWSKPLQKFRNGALIRPTMTDGELLRVALGTRLPRFAKHMGLLVNDGEVSPLLAAVIAPDAEHGERR